MAPTSLEDTIKLEAKKRNNAHFMLVDGMSKVMTQKVTLCESLDFSASGLKWKLSIKSGVAKDHLSFYLYITDELCTGSNWKVNCSFKLSVVSQTGSPDISRPCEACYDSNNSGWGAHSFISLDVLKEKCLVNDKAIFCAEIIQVKPISLNVTSIPRTMGTAERFKLMEVPRNNSRFTWKITQFSSFDGENHSSYEFTVGPRRWYLKMYPKGNLEGKGNSLSLFLHASDYVTNARVEATSAVFKLRVLDQLKRNHHEMKTETRFSPIKKEWGYRKFLPLEELHKASRGFLVNDEIYLGVEFLFISTHEYL